ncbi:MAG TPA: nodulation protein NfeD [Anaerolineaceae bacterium]|nr:nodulation protein NfeD [Anaerolineaceae bacterium]
MKVWRNRPLQNRSWLLIGVFIALFASLFPWSALAQDSRPLVAILTANGEITIPMANYLARTVLNAEQRGADLIIIQLNTPGGDINVMNQMVQTIRGSSVPVVVYVAPRGAMAASAGTLITLAGHAAAMAPDTEIGAASPVGPSGEDIGQTLESKIKNTLKATARSLAQYRRPEAIQLAEETIESARAVSANEALQVGLVDFIASDIPDLLRKLDGFQVHMNGDQVITLQTANATTMELPNSFIEQLLGVLVNPNIVFLLLTIGVQAILIELSSPGGWIAGFIGVVCLALAAYGLGILPVNWFGLLFLAIAFVLFILDIKAPTHGALTAAGVGTFIIGALVLFNGPNVPEIQQVSVPLVVVTGLVTALVFFTIVSIGVRAQRIPVRIRQSTLIGKTGIARSDLNPDGNVQVASELWSAELADGEAPIPTGANVEVVQVDGLRLKVRKSSRT